MKIELWGVGKTKFKFIENGVGTYLQRISRFASIQLIEIPKGKSSKSASAEQVKSEEAISILKRLKENDYLVLLDEKGQFLDSKQFANFIGTHRINRTSRLIFLIGGAYGFSPRVYQRGNYRLSLSQMTFSHQIVKLIFLEQFYRALTILNNHPYHND